MGVCTFCGMGCQMQVMVTDVR
ncbi:MAG: hypothetical protein ACRDTC_13635 [Pseudonocardiaceae bacterium]